MSDPQADKVWPQFFEFYRAVHDRKLSTVDGRVLLAIARHVDIQGECFVSLPTLAQKTGLSISSVSRSLGRSFEAGWAERFKGGIGTEVSYYRLNIPPKIESGDLGKFVKSSGDEGSRHTSHTVCAEIPHSVGTDPIRSRHTSHTGIGTRPTITIPVNYPLTTPGTAAPAEPAARQRKIKRGRETRQDLYSANFSRLGD